MAKHGTKETNEAFQRREFPARIRAVGQKTDKILAPGSKASEKEKAQARKAQAAALRVGSRLSKRGEPATQAAGTNPGRDESTGKKVRRKIRKTTGTQVIHTGLSGVAKVAEAARRKRAGG